MNHGIVQGLHGVLIDEVFYSFYTEEQFGDFSAQIVNVIFKEKVFVNEDTQQLKILRWTVIVYSFCNIYHIRVHWLAYFVSILKKMAVSMVNNFSASLKSNEFSFCHVHCHSVRTKPVSNFV